MIQPRPKFRYELDTYCTLCAHSVNAAYSIDNTVIQFTYLCFDCLHYISSLQSSFRGTREYLAVIEFHDWINNGEVRASDLVHPNGWIRYEACRVTNDLCSKSEEKHGTKS